MRLHYLHLVIAIFKSSGTVWCGKMFALVLNILFICSFIQLNVEADSQQELQKQYMNALRECSQEYTLSTEDLEELKNSKMPDSEKVKCYFACSYKSAGMMDGEGKFWGENVRKMSLQQYGNDESVVQKINHFVDACNKVNEVQVSDGEKGCERAALMFKCSNEHASELGFI